jgi:hypothetical protein
MQLVEEKSGIAVVKDLLNRTLVAGRKELDNQNENQCQAPVTHIYNSSYLRG